MNAWLAYAAALVAAITLPSLPLILMLRRWRREDALRARDRTDLREARP